MLVHIHSYEIRAHILALHDNFNSQRWLKRGKNHLEIFWFWSENHTEDIYHDFLHCA